MRLTIDYGIDLGTTNSAIARYTGTGASLYAHPDSGAVLLPSAVYFNATGDIKVGEPARTALHEDAANTALEFKRLMGTTERRRFPSSGRELTPEQLSAAVLSELLRWAEHHDHTRPTAAVITVPAMFQLPQCDATRRAAELAGLTHIQLLQEPIAAAVAHAGSGEVGDGYTLVYDLGGGTFDISLVRARAGRLQVVDHDGDNHLGGKDFDRLIVRKATEVIRAEGRAGEFMRTDPRHEIAFALLKEEAERVRLALSQKEQVQFSIDKLTRSERGEWVGVAFTLDRGELEMLLAPLVLRTTGLCKRLLERNRLQSAEIRGLVLVGGPTRTPCLPGLLREALGIPARHSLDPMTIVAQGAAIFAATQKLPAGASGQTAPPQRSHRIELQVEYEPMTTNPAPLLVLKARPGLLPPQATALVQRMDGGFTSQPMKFSAQGACAVELQVLRGKPNGFRIEVRDQHGTPVPTSPEELTILHGLSVARPPLSQSVGVVLADNHVEVYLRKGVVLPTRQTKSHVTTIELRRGQSGDAVKVPLVQGESDRGDRNKVIGVLHIHAERISRDLPTGSQVEVTLSVDESARTVAWAYVPLLDQRFDDVVRFQMESKEAIAVTGGLTSQRERLARLSTMAEDLEAAAGITVDQRISEVEELIEEGDRDSVDLADQLVRVLTRDIDRAESEQQVRTLKDKAAAHTETINDLLARHGEPGDRELLTALTPELATALKLGDMPRAEAKVAELSSLAMRLLQRTPGFWIGLFKYLAERIMELGRSSAAQGQLTRGQLAMAQGDIGRLASLCQELIELLPASEQKSRALADAGLVSNIR